MKKRILAIVLGTAMTLSMVGCGGNSSYYTGHKSTGSFY